MVVVQELRHTESGRPGIIRRNGSSVGTGAVYGPAQSTETPDDAWHSVFKPDTSASGESSQPVLPKKNWVDHAAAVVDSEHLAMAETPPPRSQQPPDTHTPGSWLQGPRKSVPVTTTLVPTNVSGESVITSTSHRTRNDVPGSPGTHEPESKLVSADTAPEQVSSACGVRKTIGESPGPASQRRVNAAFVTHSPSFNNTTSDGPVQSVEEGKNL